MTETGPEVPTPTEGPPAGPTLMDKLAGARSKLIASVGEERVAAVSEATRKGLAGASGAYRAVEDKATQAQAWDEAQGLLDDLVAVVRTQHAMLVDLLERVGSLEAPTGTTTSTAAGLPPNSIPTQP